MSWYSLPNFLISIYTLLLGTLVLKANHKSQRNRACFYLACSTFLWLFFYGILYSTEIYRYAIPIAKLGHLGAIIVPPAVYYFVNTVLGDYQKPLDRSLFRVSVAISGLAATLLFSATPLYFNGLIKRFWGYYPLGGPLMIVFSLWTFLMAMRALYNLARASSRAKKEFRLSDYNQFKYYALSLSIFMIGAVDYIPKFGIKFDFYPFGYICVALFSSLITYGILKHELLNVRIAIKRGFVYSALISIITFVYFSIIFLGEHFFRTFFRYGSLLAILSASSVIAVVFNPIRQKIQTVIDAHFFLIDPEKLGEENLRLRAAVQNQDRMKAVATLAAGMAHEIKNPLTAIRTFTEHLPSRADDPAFINKFVAIVGSEVTKIDSIVKQLLEFSKPTPPKLERVDITQILDNTLLLLHAEFLKVKIEVIKEYAIRPVYVNGDRGQLQQALLNLILNSIQAMPGGGQLTLTVSDSKNGKTVLSITDTGMGIPKENLAHIFDPFFTTKEGGTGLGLAVTHGILKKHSCEVSVSSCLNRGTSVRLLFNAN